MSPAVLSSWSVIQITIPAGFHGLPLLKSSLTTYYGTECSALMPPQALTTGQQTVNEHIEDERARHRHELGPASAASLPQILSERTALVLYGNSFIEPEFTYHTSHNLKGTIPLFFKSRFTDKGNHH